MSRLNQRVLPDGSKVWKNLESDDGINVEREEEEKKENMKMR